jgi:glyoxylase-like metal-dependent hydrolase (beta-lactamase superfamily II)
VPETKLRERIVPVRPMRVVTNVADNIYQVRVPVPFPLKNVQCYLIRDPDGWTLIDTGLHYDPAYEAWEEAFKSLQIDPKQIRRIFITHAHPDHYGLAGHFQNLSNAPVYALDEEIRIIRIEWERAGAHMVLLEEFLQTHGMPSRHVGQTVERSLEILRMLEPQPQLTPLFEGEVVQLGGCQYKILWTPGHADGHLMLHGQENGLLFSGDMILMKITPNIPLWPALDPNPLKSYLTSLDRIERLNVKLAFPGHRALIQDVRGRIAELRQHHQQRADKCSDAAKDGHSAFEICMQVFPDIKSVDDVRLAMVETLAHLEWLVGEGRLEKLDGSVILYRQVIV